MFVCPTKPQVFKMTNTGKNMNYNKELFYTLDEVRELLLKTEDRSYSKDESIVRLIHTDRLTPYISYSGPVDIVTEAEDVPEKSIKEITDSLYHTISTQMCNLEIGETIHPHDYDSSTSLRNTKRFIEKLLFSLNAKRATKNLGVSILVEGVFRLLPLSVTYLGGNLEVSLGPKMFIPEKIEADFGDKDLNNDEIKNILGYTLSPINKDDYELIFLKNDLQYIITVIESSHELPKLRNSLSDTNRIISQKNKEIEILRKKLDKSQSQQTKNDVKDSAYSLILVLKDLLLNPDISAYHFKSESPKSTGKPTQSGLIQHIVDENIPKLGRRNIEDIFADANERYKR